MSIEVDVRLPKWDDEADVVVLGYGYAGAASAIYAKDAGAKDVLILEKMPRLGGYSILSGGRVIGGNNYENLLKYFKALCSERTPDEVIEAQVEGLTKVFGYVDELCKVNNAKYKIFGVAAADDVNIGNETRSSGATYPSLPGSESLKRLAITEIPGFDGYPWLRTQYAGGLLMKVLEDNVNHRGVRVKYNTPSKELVTDASGVVIGVKAKNNEKEIYVKAKKAVIIATGGFEANEWMKLQFCEAKPIYTMGPSCNTGDGIIMAQKAGAALWHMWHIHGSYGFKFPELKVGIRITPGGTRIETRKIQWILVDKIRGERFMNEIHPAPQDTMHRPFEYFDPDIPDLHVPDFPRIPSWMIFDEPGRKIGPIANPLSAYEEDAHEWSRDNSKEVEKGWILKAESLEELAEKIKVDAKRLKNTIDRWNRFVDQGKDEDFDRPPGTMVSIKTPPFYAVQVWPIVTNTQGGPEHNAKQQIVDAFRKPIPRLYAAGECGSFYGHLYQLAGNISECIISGHIAGTNAANETPWC